ncbi:hypothetical protein D9M72_620450 [compost metagenome]
MIGGKVFGQFGNLQGDHEAENADQGKGDQRGGDHRKCPRQTDAAQCCDDGGKREGQQQRDGDRQEDVAGQIEDGRGTDEGQRRRHGRPYALHRGRTEIADLIDCLAQVYPPRICQKLSRMMAR